MSEFSDYWHDLSDCVQENYKQAFPEINDLLFHLHMTLLPDEKSLKEFKFERRCVSASISAVNRMLEKYKDEALFTEVVSTRPDI